MTDTLKSICEQCAHLNSPRLDFIPAQLVRHRDIIIRGLRELVLATSSESEKTVVVLCGILLEAILYTFIWSQQSYIAQRRGSFTFYPEQSLSNYVSIFNRWFSDVLPNAVLPDFVIDYRAIVHINRELQFPPDICGVASRDFLRILDSFLGEISQFPAPE